MAVLPSYVIWEVNKSAIANRYNGGAFDPSKGGVDYTYGDNAQVIVYTDLKTDGLSNYKITSDTRPFVAADAGNVIRITGGSGWTPGRYLITSVSNGVATLHATVATGGSTGGQGRLGGPVDHPSCIGEVGSQENGEAQTMFIEAGTYTFTNRSIAYQGALAGTSMMLFRLVPYSGTRSTIGRATFDYSAATSGTYNWCVGALVAHNIDLIGPGRSYAIDGFYLSNAIGCSARDFGSEGFAAKSTFGCFAHNCTYGFTPSGSDYYGRHINAVASGCQYGFSGYNAFLVWCLAYNCSTGFSGCFTGVGNGAVLMAINCSTGISAMQASSGPLRFAYLHGCGVGVESFSHFGVIDLYDYNCTTPVAFTPHASMNRATLTGNPFASDPATWDAADPSTWDMTLTGSNGDILREAVNAAAGWGGDAWDLNMFQGSDGGGGTPFVKLLPRLVGG